MKNSIILLFSIYILSSNAFEDDNFLYNTNNLTASYLEIKVTSECSCNVDSPDIKNNDHLCLCSGAAFLDIPQNMTNNVTIITVQNAGLEVLKSDSLVRYSEMLHSLNLENLENFYHIETGAFRSLKQLQTLYIYRAPKLRKILPEVFSTHLPKLKVIRISSSGLQYFPALNELKFDAEILEMIELDHNQIQKISTGQMENIDTYQLDLSFNDIRIVEEKAFVGSRIGTLNLRGNNKLSHLDEKAFVGLENLSQIDLSDTAITFLPTAGLANINVLRVENTYTMKTFPSVYNFKEIKEAKLTYHYHCCAFKYPKTHSPKEFEKQQANIKSLLERCKNAPAISWNTLQDPLDKHLAAFLQDRHIGEEDGTFHNSETNISFKTNCENSTKMRNFQEVMCSPKPDAFNPCEDVMGNWGLRIPVWIVSQSAVIGNLFVIIVIGTSHFRWTVSKFLMCNLAFADLCIGIHLLLLAGIDAHSIGAYFNIAIDWQEGYGCNVAGFLTIFGNVLSVYTLAVITVERWCTITWAAHLNKRLKFRTCVKIMLGGWICALIMAILPLNGISSYSRSSICLPLESKNKIDLLYLATLLAFNCAAFGLICVCYGSMYRTIRAAGRTRITSTVRNDQNVAKKMALLVFTDFACWSPIAFFGTTALMGYPLITVPHIKILLVFIYPLNSCANPCLYAMLTQQYRKDFFVFVGKIGICKKHAEAKRGAIRGKPLPYTAQFKKANNHSRLKNKSSAGGSNTTRSSTVTITTVTVELPQRNSSQEKSHINGSKMEEKFTISENL